MPYEIDEPLKKPIELKTTSYTHGRTFSTLLEARNWAAECAQWFRDNVQNLIQDHDVGFHDDFRALAEPFDAIADEINRYHSSEKRSAQALGAIVRATKAGLATVEKGASFSRDSEIYQYLNNTNMVHNDRLGFLGAVMGLDLHKKHPRDGLLWLRDPNVRTQVAGGIEFARLAGFTKPSTRPDLSKTTAAVARATARTQELEARIETLDEETKNYEMARSARVESTRKVVSDAISSSRDEFAEMRDLHFNEMEGIRKAFDQFVQVDDAAEYWKKRSTSAMTTAFVTSLGFAILVAASVLATFTYGDEYLHRIAGAVGGASTGEAGQSNVTGATISALAQFAFVSLPAGLMFWLLRIPARIIRENIHLMNDAKHRQMLITTYLSMLRNNPEAITEQERKIIFQNVFSPPADLRQEESNNPLMGVPGMRS